MSRELRTKKRRNPSDEIIDDDVFDDDRRFDNEHDADDPMLSGHRA